jgi:uncharacterized membrane protein YjjB (DUF3815 family)
MLLILKDAFWSGIAALGFAMLFNVPQRALVACIICGALGHATRTALMETGIEIVPATLFGATLVGFMANYYARRQRMPTLIYAVSGAIPQVPGVYAFQTMIYILRITTTPDNAALNEALTQATRNGVITGMVLGALALGIAMPTLLFERHKPVV